MNTAYDRPRLADGLELVGRFEGSGFNEPPYLARRADGQVIQLPELLYRVAADCDGRRSCAAIAARVTKSFGRELGPGDVRFLLEEKLRPLGLLAAGDGRAPTVKKVDPLLGLKFRAGIVPERVVHAVTTPFLPLFWPPVVAAVIAGLVALDVWLFFLHGISTPTRELLYQPLLIVGLFALAALAAGFHEIGHATACRYGGARPGRMGAGLYIVWPAFYTDVTDAYRLGRWGRLRTDLAGVYFNAIFSLATAGVYFATRFEPLLMLVLLQHLEMLRQLLPFLRLDGYYVISDLTGVPDILSRIKPTLRSLIPWRKPEPRVAELKPWVRFATTGYVLTLLPATVFVFALMAMHAPRVFATAWDALTIEWGSVAAAFSDGAVLIGVAGSLQILALVLPPVGLALTGTRIATRLGRGTWGMAANVPGLQAGLATAGATAVAFVGFLWWPNGDYRPIQPGEHGTAQAAVASLQHIPSGRPALTVEREGELGGAPTLRERASAPRGMPGSNGTPGDRAQPREDRPPEEERQIDGKDRPTTPPGETEADTAPSGTEAETESETEPAGGTSSQARGPDTTNPSASIAGLLVALATATAGGGDNSAIAVNTRDDTAVFRLAFQIVRVMNGVVDQMNLAVAYASCERCTTTAIAIQAVLVGAVAETIAPTNLAVAINEQCTLCTTMAFAYQFVLGTNGPAHFTPEGNRAVSDIRRRLHDLRHEQLAPTELDARLSAIVAELGTVLREEVVTAEPPADDTETAPAEPPPDDTETTPEQTEPPPTDTETAPDEAEPPPEDTETTPDETEPPPEGGEGQ